MNIPIDYRRWYGALHHKTLMYREMVEDNHDWKFQPGLLNALHELHELYIQIKHLDRIESQSGVINAGWYEKFAKVSDKLELLFRAVS